MTRGLGDRNEVVGVLGELVAGDKRSEFTWLIVGKDTRKKGKRRIQRGGVIEREERERET